MNQGRIRRLRARVVESSDRVIVGEAVDLDDLEARLVVELLLDGWPVRLARANLFDERLLKDGVGDGCYGFRFVLDDAMARNGGVVEVRLANAADVLGGPMRIGATVRQEPSGGNVRWMGGLRLAGWIEAKSSGEAPVLHAVVDGEVVAQTRADRWSYLTDAAAAVPVRAFELVLPESFADGRAHRVQVIDPDGLEAPGSPVPILAFRDGLQKFCADHSEIQLEQARGAVFDALFPRSHPMRDYVNWLARFPLATPLGSKRASALVLLVGAADPGASLESLEMQQGADWVAAGLGDQGPVEFANEDLGESLAMQGGSADFVVFAPAGVVFAPNALACLSAALASHPEAKIAYGDVTALSSSGEEWPIAFPAFDYERMLEQGYAGFVFAAKLDHVKAARDAGVADLFALFLFAVEVANVTAANAIAHVPGFLARLPEFAVDRVGETLGRAVEAHLTARQKAPATQPAFASRFPALWVVRKSAPGRLSVIVATRDNPQNLRYLLSALDSAARGANAEVIVVDVDSASDETLQLLEELSSNRIRATRISGPYQPERAFNAAANIANGDTLLFASDDMRPLREDWLAEMLSRLAEPDAGAVTPMFIWPSGVVQQCGLVVGMDFGVARAFSDAKDGDLGYGEMLAVAHEVGAANAVGLLTRKSDFLQFGGFDVQRYGHLYAGVDYTLRLRAAGRRIIATPRAKLVRSRIEEGGDRASPELGDRASRELEALRSAWGDTLANDLMYSPLLALAGAPYSALAWPPRSTASRAQHLLAARSRPDWI